MKIKEHKWNREDTIISLYYYKFGVKYLYPIVKDEVELAKNIIGSSVESLRIQAANIGCVLTKRGSESPSKLHETIVEEFSGVNENDLREEVIQIIESDDRKIVITERIKIRKDQIILNKEKEKKKELDSIFKKLGKDPSKMKFVGSRPKVVED